MSLIDDWMGRFAVLYLAWPILVMLAFVTWKSFKADTIRGLLTGLGAIVVFGAMAFFGWLFGSAVVFGTLIIVLNSLELAQDLSQFVIVLLMVMVMTVGAVLGWAYLNDEMGSDARFWKL